MSTFSRAVRPSGERTRPTVDPCNTSQSAVVTSRRRRGGRHMSTHTYMYVGFGVSSSPAQSRCRRLCTECMYSSFASPRFSPSGLLVTCASLGALAITERAKRGSSRLLCAATARGIDGGSGEPPFSAFNVQTARVGEFCFRLEACHQEFRYSGTLAGWRGPPHGPKPEAVGLSFPGFWNGWPWRRFVCSMCGGMYPYRCVRCCCMPPVLQVSRGAMIRKRALSCVAVPCGCLSPIFCVGHCRAFFFPDRRRPLQTGCCWDVTSRRGTLGSITVRAVDYTVPPLSPPSPADRAFSIGRSSRVGFCPLWGGFFLVRNWLP